MMSKTVAKRSAILAGFGLGLLLGVGLALGPLAPEPVIDRQYLPCSGRGIVVEFHLSPTGCQVDSLRYFDVSN